MSKEKNKKEELNEETDTVVEDVDQSSSENEITVDDLLVKLAELKKRADDQTALAAKERARADEMTNVAARMRADFDNYRKRTNDSISKERENGRLEVLEKNISVIDVVEQALTMIQDESVKNGVQMIKTQLVSMLQAFGVCEVDATGEFDPKKHEAIMRVPCETPEQNGTIKEVFQKGYAAGERLLRPARVIVYND